MTLPGFAGKIDRVSYEMKAKVAGFWPAGCKVPEPAFLSVSFKARLGSMDV